jgi:hypothetical protein
MNILVLKNLSSITKYILVVISIFTSSYVSAQILINEGSNRNYTTISDEDNEYKDWIELFNAGATEQSLLNYSLTDDQTNPTKWVFPNISIEAGGFKTVFCSSKDRAPISAFQEVAYITNYTPITSWNTHTLAEPFYWDGVSNVLISTCAYNNFQYTTNSVFIQTATDYFSTIFAFQDNSDEICSTAYGTRVKQRPNMKLNNVVIGTGDIQNGNTEYPAPYGNWYWASKHQMLITADELSASGLTAGQINSLSFQVAGTDPNTTYTYINILMKLVTESELTTEFFSVDVNVNQHTNFSLAGEGETVYLFSPEQSQLSQLNVNCTGIDNSVGSSPNGSPNIVIFGVPTPSESNNSSQSFDAYLLAPVISVSSGLFDTNVPVTISNPNPNESIIRYTLNGNDPTLESPIYTGSVINISSSSVLKARAFSDVMLPSPIAVSTYLIGINHTTAVLSVVTDNSNLYGENGIFDHWESDWEKSAYVEYFDTEENMIFSQAAGMQIDGGAGGSRSQPQHSFRIELDHSVLGAASIDYPLISGRPQRTKYSKIYLRNGSNQYLTLPYKDAVLVTSLGAETKNFYSAMEPITVYINGQYFGLYELREKIDDEYFEEYENADADSLDVLTLSYWYNLVLRASVGSTERFYESYNQFVAIDPAQESFWDNSDQYFDMEQYVDYIIAEAYAGNADWPYNNIKMYCSNKTNNRFRFGIVDLELCLQPNGWTSTSDDPIDFLFTRDPNIPYINIWLRGIQNDRFKNYFINRFADLMNTVYNSDRILNIENEFYLKMAAEMPKEYARWGDAGNVAGQMNEFNERHSIFQSELSSRTMFVRNYINLGFDLDGQVEVTLNTIPEGAGRIKISTVIPETLPWTGVYFNGNPVTITAISNNGFEFAYWNGNAVLDGQNPNESLNLNVFTSTSFVAVFTETELLGEMAISEINYHSDTTRNAGDWIEFVNFGNGPIDISGWKFFDSNVLNEFEFPEGTIVQPGERLVLAEDLVKFNSQHTSPDYIWDMNMGFSNSGETLTLADDLGFVVKTLHYTDSLPWPEAADGYGRTLEIVNDSYDPALPSSWFAGCIGGSPGEAYSPCSEDIIITEINYNSDGTADAGDWIELHNTSATEINLSNWKFRDDDDLHTFTFSPGVVIPSGGYLVVYANYDKFISRFPDVSNITGPFSFGLGGSGDAVRLFDQNGNLYQSVVYSNLAPWPQGAAGNGYTLELSDYNGLFCEGNNWIDGCLEGSPGEELVLPCGTNVPEYSVNLDLHVYPNPSNGVFTVSGTGLIAGIYKISCKNVLGQIVFEEERNIDQNSGNLNFSFENFDDGLYFLSIETEETRGVVKIVKQNK